MYNMHNITYNLLGDYYLHSVVNLLTAGRVSIFFNGFLKIIIDA